MHYPSTMQTPREDYDLRSTEKIGSKLSAVVGRPPRSLERLWASERVNRRPTTSASPN